MALEHYYTIGELLDFIKFYNLPLDGKVYLQRVPDFYFDKPGNSWNETSEFLPNEQTNFLERTNAAIASGEYSNKENYPDIKTQKSIGVQKRKLKHLDLSTFLVGLLNYTIKKIYTLHLFIYWSVKLTHRFCVSG